MRAQIHFDEPSRLPPLPPRKNNRRVTMPERVGPFVRLVFSEMARQAVRYDDMEWLSGVRRATIKAWRRKNAPGLVSVEAALGVLGYNLTPTPAIEKLPPRLAGEIATLAAKLQSDIPTTWAAMISIGVEQRLLRMQADERRAILAEREVRKTGGPLRYRRNPAATAH